MGREVFVTPGWASSSLPAVANVVLKVMVSPGYFQEDLPLEAVISHLPPPAPCTETRKDRKLLDDGGAPRNRGID